MPRFGANKILTIDQIKDAVALLMSPDSPVNKDQEGNGHEHDQPRGLSARLRHPARRSPPRASAPAPANLEVAALKKDTDVACVYHCDFGDQQRFSQMLTNMNNHLSAYEFDPAGEARGRGHAAGLKFFLDDLSGTPWEKETINEDLYKRFVGLCANSGSRPISARSPTSARTSTWRRRGTIRS